MTGDEVARLLGLAPMPIEGGRWTQTWRDEHGSAIYFLMQPGDFSAMHRLDGPELWHHYAGAAVQMLLLDQDGQVNRPVLGDDLSAGQRPFVAVPAGVWMGARTTGDWSLVGTTMAPPFHPRWLRDRVDRAAAGRVPGRLGGDRPLHPSSDTMTELASPGDLLDLEGRVVIVTGAGGGIGTGIATRLARAGATVVAHARTRASLDDLTATIGALATVVADLRSPDAPGVVVEAAVAQCGRVDGLVNNAGVQPTVPFTELDDGQWQEMIDTNLTAVHRLSQAAAEQMRRQGDGGSIVHIASIEAHHPTLVHGHYATSKAALVMHAKAAALANGPDGIRVNAISPGLIARPGIEQQWPEGVARWTAAAPLGRLGTPDDIGDACVFLCSDLSRWITGAELVVDGGVLTNPTW